jgi:hypothetical protein
MISASEKCQRHSGRSEGNVIPNKAKGTSFRAKRRERHSGRSEGSVIPSEAKEKAFLLKECFYSKQCSGLFILSTGFICTHRFLFADYLNHQ